MPAVTGADVAAFLGLGDDAGQLVAQAQRHADLLTTLAKAYTRGRGFDEDGAPNAEIASVVTLAAARLLANPEQIATDIGNVSYRGGWNGWSLAEQIVLNRYRVRAQ